MAVSNHEKIDTGVFKEIRRESGHPDFRPIGGKELKYDKGFDKDGNMPGGYAADSYEGADHAYYKPGEESSKAANMGLPLVVYGSPLGCGCSEAYLHGVGDVINGQLEADYMCSSGWHNFIEFSMRTQDIDPERAIKIDKYGNFTEDRGYEAKELEEM